MLLYFYFYIFLIHGVKSGDVAIANCNKAVGQFQRPTVDPSLCAHIDLPACAAIFPYDNANAGATIASHFNPGTSYLIPETCTQVLKDFAEKNCPSRCAFCCKAKQFNCANENQNATAAQSNCRDDDQQCSENRKYCTIEPYATVMRSKCRLTCGHSISPHRISKFNRTNAWQPLIIRILRGTSYLIPETCTQVLKDFAEKNCPSRCAFCCKAKQFNCANENQNATAAQSNCRDDDQQCSENRKYCTIEPYATVMRSKCRLTCGHCQP
ncbi:unnamed protein product [Dracunculus medinensis]|uniref:ShKT domain-containing protein n=1 Tax=Dracunculus medinensis TaxID=318479 RepID=A0A0N4UQT8_DRAME|nr:unnamed protein product [Dracunculus medinensis]